MRDDLHKAAPISKGLQKLMQRSGRAADRADPAGLRDAAVVPMLKELERNLPKGAAAHFAADQENPSLFRIVFQGPTVSAFQQDLNAETEADPTASNNDLLKRAVRIQIESQCNESAAAMLAAGGTRKEVDDAVNAYRQACDAATQEVVDAYLHRQKPQPTSKALGLDDTIPAGPRARLA